MYKAFMHRSGRGGPWPMYVSRCNLHRCVLTFDGNVWGWTTCNVHQDDRHVWWCQLDIHDSCYLICREDMVRGVSTLGAAWLFSWAVSSSIHLTSWTKSCVKCDLTGDAMRDRASSFVERLFGGEHFTIIFSLVNLLVMSSHCRLWCLYIERFSVCRCRWTECHIVDERDFSM